MTPDVPRVSVVVPTWNSAAWLAGCLDGLRAQTYRDFRVIVVDNGSTDETLAVLRDRYPEVEVVALARNHGFAHAVNVGIARGSSPYVALLNVDTRPEPDWLARLVARLDASPAEVGSAASLMLNLEAPDLVDSAGDELSWYGSGRKRGHGCPARDYAAPGEVFSACAGAALYRRALFDAIGLFDERYTSYFEDVDVGLRSRVLGYRCAYEPAARTLHQGHGSGLARGRYVTLMTRNRLLTFAKNIPAWLLARHAATLAAGQLYFLAAYRRPLRSLAGYAGFLRALPHALRERRRILRARVIPLDALDAALSRALGEPPIGELVARKLAKPSRPNR